jgi:hypothetical protein
VRCGLEFDFLDVVVAADGTPYVSLVDGCTAEECHSRLGQGIVGHLASGPPLVGTAGEQRPRVTLPRRCRRPLRIRLRQPRRGRLVSARIYVNGRRVRTVRGRARAVHRALGAVTGGASISSHGGNETRGAVMKVFVAGATGVLGRALVPQLVARGHEVVGMTRSASKQDLVRGLGARPVVADALDPDAVAHAVASAEPEVIVHQLTA